MPNEWQVGVKDEREITGHSRLRISDCGLRIVSAGKR
jgi:hypothetical protein